MAQMDQLVPTSLWVLRTYVSVLLYFPRLVVYLNLHYNPFVVFMRRLVLRITGLDLVGMVAQALLTEDVPLLTLNDAEYVTESIQQRQQRQRVRDAALAVMDETCASLEAAKELEDKLNEDVVVDEEDEEAAKGFAEEVPINSLEQHVSASSPPTMPEPLRWLEPGEKNGEHVAIVSYPRSGNSLMRGLLEKITGVYTGCDTRPDRALSQALKSCGMEGEGVVDDSVWFVKTHFPERTGWKPFKVKKAILVVRNPWDAIDSYFNMTLTNTHNKSIHESQYKRFEERWDGMIRNEIDVWMRFHHFWTCKVQIPIMVVRYEDLLVHREETMRRVFLFLLDVKSLDSTPWPERIERVVCESQIGPYKPRKGKIGASFAHFSHEQFDYILQKAKLPLRGFGYDPVTQKFPDQLPLPRRQVKPATNPEIELEIPIDASAEIRKKNDMYGRWSTWYRKSLTEPVLASDGTELNVDEVEAARKKMSSTLSAGNEIQESETDADASADDRS